MTSNKELMRLAALKNCEGASLLADEKLDDAVAKFTIAYHCVGRATSDNNNDADYDTNGRRSINNDNSTNSSNNSDNNDNNDNACITSEAVDKYHFILDNPQVAWYLAARDESGSNPSNGNIAPNAFSARSNSCISRRQHIFFSTEAMVFHPENAIDPRTSPFFEAVIIFNMGLSFHHACEVLSPMSNNNDGSESAGTSTALSSEASWRHSHSRAMACYNQCLARIKKGEYSDAMSQANSYVEAHMLIATLNNKIQLLFSIGDYYQAYCVLREFHSVMEKAAGHLPGFDETDIAGLEGTLELLNTAEISAVIKDAMERIPSSNSEAVNSSG